MLQTHGPKALMVLGPSYGAYANSNPTHPISHPFHILGLDAFGALGAAPRSELHLTWIDNIQTVHPHLNGLQDYLDPNHSPNISVMKYRIHSDPVEYAQ